jgi:hypothetical protein
MHTYLLSDVLKGDHCGDQVEYGRIILKGVLKFELNRAVYIQDTSSGE